MFTLALTRPLTHQTLPQNWRTTKRILSSLPTVSAGPVQSLLSMKRGSTMRCGVRHFSPPSFQDTPHQSAPGTEAPIIDPVMTRDFKTAWKALWHSAFCRKNL
jgi:hypothetical protein